MTLPSERTSREIRAGRINRRPPSFVVTLVALAIIFALAWTFFLRSGPAAPTPRVEGIQGTYTWEPPAPLASGRTARSAPSRAATPAARRRPRRPSSEPARRPRPTTRRRGRSRLRVSHGPAGHRRAHRRRLAAGLARRHAAARWTTRAWRPSCARRSRTATTPSASSRSRTATAPCGERRMTLERQADRARRRPGDRHRDLVQRRARPRSPRASTGGRRRPPARPTRSTRRRAATVETTAAGDVHLRGVAGGSRAHGRLRPAGLGPGAGRLRTQGRRHHSTTRTGRWSGSRRSRQAVPVAPAPRNRGRRAAVHARAELVHVEQVGPAATRAFEPRAGSAASRRAGVATSCRYQETTLQYGALQGATASTWYQESGPTLFVRSARRAVFITGALTRQELIAFAEGLKPVPANAGR